MRKDCVLRRKLLSVKNFIAIIFKEDITQNAVGRHLKDCARGSRPRIAGNTSLMTASSFSARELVRTNLSKVSSQDREGNKDALGSPNLSVISL